LLSRIIEDLSPSTRRKIIIGGGIVFVLAYLNFFVFPSLKYLSTLQEGIPKKRQELKEMEALAQECSTLKEELKGAKTSITQKQEKSIFFILDTVARSGDLSKHISSMVPVSLFTGSAEYEETGVQVKMKEVKLRALVHYLYKIENPPYLLKIKNLDIKPQRRNRSFLEVNFTVSRLKKKD